MSAEPVFHVREGEGRPALVFVHGFGCAHEDWRHQVQAFRDRHAVVACDLRGHGRSTGFADGFDIETYGADVAGLVESLDLGPAVLVGHSMGCRVVLEAASERPELAAGVVLVDGSRVAEGDREAAAFSMRAVLEEVDYGDFMRRFFADMFLPSSDSDLRAAAVARAADLPEAIGRPLLESMAGYDAAMVDGALSGLECPVLVVQSTYLNEDRVRVPLGPGDSTPWTRCVDRTAPETEVRIIDGVGHFSMLEAPERLNEILASFLSRLAGRAAAS